MFHGLDQIKSHSLLHTDPGQAGTKWHYLLHITLLQGGVDTPSSQTDLGSFEKGIMIFLGGLLLPNDL